MPYRASLRLTGSPAVWGGGRPCTHRPMPPPGAAVGALSSPQGRDRPGLGVLSPGSIQVRQEGLQRLRACVTWGEGRLFWEAGAGGLGSRGPPPRDTTCPLHLRPELGPAVPSRQHVLTFLRDRHRVLMTVHRTSSGGQGPPSELWLPAQPLGQGGVCRGSPARRRAQDPAPRLSGWLLLAGAISPI